jgi:hypothetical protein
MMDFVGDLLLDARLRKEDVIVVKLKAGYPHPVEVLIKYLDRRSEWVSIDQISLGKR